MPALPLALAILLSTLIPSTSDSLATGSLEGRILAARGETVAGANVVVEGTLLMAVSNREGKYRLRGVPAGEARLLVTGLGIAPARRTVEVDAGRTHRLDLQVEIRPVELATLTVTTHRMVQRQSAPRQTLVVDAPEVERFGDPTVGELLRRQVGIVTGGPPGEAKDIRLRGLDKEYTQVLVDGRRLPDGGEKREFALDRIPASLVERVEIVRNPTATLPAQGIGGSVNVILKDVPPEGLMEWEAGAGSTGSADFRLPSGHAFLHAGGRMGEVGWLAGGGLQQRFSPRTKARVTTLPQETPGGGEAEEEEKRLRDLSLNPRLSWMPSDRDRLTLSPLLLHTEERIDRVKEKSDGSGALKESESSGEDKARTGLRLQGEWTRHLATGGALELRAGYQQSREEKDRASDRYKGGDKLDRTDVENERKREEEVFGTLGLQLFQGQAHTLVAGLDGTWRDRNKAKTKLERKASGEESDKTGPRDNYQIREAEVSAYFQDEWRLGTRHILTPGLRLEWVANRARSAGAESPEQEGMSVSPSLHYLFALNPSTNVRAALARTLRRPKFDDLIPYLETRQGTLLSPDRVGNPALAPEAALSVEAGVERFFGRAGALGVTAFAKEIRSRIENGVELDAATGRWVERPSNVGRGRMVGVEVDARASLEPLGLHGFTFYGNVALYHSRLRVADGGGERPFDKQPPYILNLGFDQLLDGLGLRAGANFNRIAATEKRETKDGQLRFETEDTGDYLDLYLAKEMPGGVELRLTARNLLEADKAKSKAFYTLENELLSRDRERERSSRTLYLTLRRSF